jgi:hypothetical protein
MCAKKVRVPRQITNDCLGSCGSGTRSHPTQKIKQDRPSGGAKINRMLPILSHMLPTQQSNSGSGNKIIERLLEDRVQMNSSLAEKKKRRARLLKNSSQMVYEVL